MVRAIMDRYGVRAETEAADLALRHQAGQPMPREQALAVRGDPGIDDVAELIAEDGPLMVTEPVLTEVLAGARSGGRESDLRRLLLWFGVLPFDAVTCFKAGARVHRRRRRARVVPRVMPAGLRRAGPGPDVGRPAPRPDGRGVVPVGRATCRC